MSLCIHSRSGQLLYALWNASSREVLQPCVTKGHTLSVSVTAPKLHSLQNSVAILEKKKKIESPYELASPLLVLYSEELRAKS